MEIDKRLTAATICLRHLHDRDVPPEYLELGTIAEFKGEIDEDPSSEYGYRTYRTATIAIRSERLGARDTHFLRRCMGER
jgi:hypothetical protein